MAKTTEPTEQPTPLSAPTSRGGRAFRLALGFAGRYRGVLALLVVLLIGAISCPFVEKTGEHSFLNWRTQNNTLFENSEYGMLAAGMTLVIITGGIDLGVGSVLGFAAMLFSFLLIAHGWSAPLAALLTVAATAVLGAINGVIISAFRIQPFVVTLGMMLLARGAAKWMTEGSKIYPGAQDWYVVKSGTPQAFDWMTAPLPMLRLQPITVLFLLCVLVLWVVLRFTRFGRYIYAIGGNQEAARLSGIRLGTVKTAAYAICGMTAGLAGICNASRMTLGDPEAGFTYELDAIAAVVIGGTSLMGGKGGMFFTLIGTLVVAYIIKILSLLMVPEAPRLVIRGGLIVIAVLIQQRRKE